MKRFMKIIYVILFLCNGVVEGFANDRASLLQDTISRDTLKFSTKHRSDSLQDTTNPVNLLSGNNNNAKYNDSTFVPEKPVYNYIFLKQTAAESTTDFFFENEAIINHRLDSLMQLPLKATDSLMYAVNPFVMPLVFNGIDIKPVWDGKLDYLKTLYGNNSSALHVIPLKNTNSEYLIRELRKSARDYITTHASDLYTTTSDRLPDPHSFLQRLIKQKPAENFVFEEKGSGVDVKKIDVVKLKPRYWSPKANALMQFTQNYISSNWYQGGNSNLAILNILSGEMNYDNKNNIQWENKMEWRAGFNSVHGDTLRKISTNDDVLRYTSKFGIKAGGNWFYSVSGDFSTQLFDNYNAINSNIFKARLMTPFRANVGIGMDYKYKKLISLMIAPVSFKYIYANDTVNVNQNLFGIKKGSKELRQVGSSLLAQLDYNPAHDWHVDSKFTFYTDYKKVEINWEIVSNLSVNRFMSVRLSLNPRYDNTVIMKKGEKAKIQFKQLLSIGFSYRLL